MKTSEVDASRQSVDAGLLMLIVPSAGLSPRDLILHFRHKVENHTTPRLLVSAVF